MELQRIDQIDQMLYQTKSNLQLPLLISPPQKRSSVKNYIQQQSLRNILQVDQLFPIIPTLKFKKHKCAYLEGNSQQKFSINKYDSNALHMSFKQKKNLKNLKQSISNPSRNTSQIQQSNEQFRKSVRNTIQQNHDSNDQILKEQVMDIRNKLGKSSSLHVVHKTKAIFQDLEKRKIETFRSQNQKHLNYKAYLNSLKIFQEFQEKGI